MNNTGSAWTDFHLELMGGGAGAIFLVSSISVTPAGTATLSAGDRTCDICFTQPVPVGGMVTINFIVRQSSAALQRLALERID